MDLANLYGALDHYLPHGNTAEFTPEFPKANLRTLAVFDLPVRQVPTCLLWASIGGIKCLSSHITIFSCPSTLSPRHWALALCHTDPPYSYFTLLRESGPNSANMTLLGRLLVAISALSVVIPVGALYVDGSVIAPCDSPIYCSGEVLRQVQLAAPFSDSKTFVDMYVVPLWQPQ